MSEWLLLPRSTLEECQAPQLRAEGKGLRPQLSDGDEGRGAAEEGEEGWREGVRETNRGGGRWRMTGVHVSERIIVETVGQHHKRGSHAGL